MASQEVIVTDESYRTILAHEDKTSWILTAKIVEKPGLSFWMFLLPIVFVPYMQQYQKYKESIKIFRSGYLYTKKIGLETAYQIFKNEISLADVPAIIEKNIKKDPQANSKILNIYQKQMWEVGLLCRHYSELLSTGKAEYSKMVVCKYQTKTNYLNFINLLAEAEKDVMVAASANLADKTAETLDVMEKMGNYLLELRLADAKQFFEQE